MGEGHAWAWRPFHLILIASLLFYQRGALAQSAGSKEYAKPDYSLYHRLDDVLAGAEATAARCGAGMHSEDRTMEMQGYNSTMKIITVEPGGLSDAGASKARLLVNFGEHGRELISPEIALRLLEILCDAEARKTLLTASGIDPAPVEAALQRAVFKIIPVENPRGRELVEGGKLCERKNGRGVDPNRNWGVHWGHKERDYDPDEEFPGSAPFSEPEVAMMRQLAEEFKPHVWLNVHSGMEALFVPYDHKNEVPEGAAAAATLAILEQLNKKLCRGKCAVGPGGKTVGYLAHGTATDYMQDELGVGLVMTWEVYGDQKAEFEDCFKMFNPLTKEGYDEVVDTWTSAILELVAELPGHPSVPELSAADVAASGEAGLQGNEGKSNSSGGGGLGRKGGAGWVVGGRPATDSSRSGGDKVGADELSSSSGIGGSADLAASNAPAYVVLGVVCAAAVANFTTRQSSRTALVARLARWGRRRQA